MSNELEYRDPTDQAFTLRIFRGDDETVEVQDGLSRQEVNGRERIEAFWAGRNHAMRRSARSAA